MNELATTENLIANYRENYNKQVKTYNAYVRKFPQRIFLDYLCYEVQDFHLLDFGDDLQDAPQDLFED